MFELDKTLFARAKAKPVEEILGRFGMLQKKGTHLICPFCGCGSGKYEEGKVNILSKKNALVCAKCKHNGINYYSNVDIVLYSMGLDDNPKNQVRVCKIILGEEEGPNLSTGSARTNFNMEQYRQDQEQKQKLHQEQKQQELLELLDQAKDPNQYTIAYLERRGIDINKISQNVKIYSYFHKGYNNIVYYFPKTRQALQKGLEKVEGKKFIRTWGGVNRPVTLPVNDSNDWYITEGIEDSLILNNMGLNAICLNSADNIGQLLEQLEKSQVWATGQMFYLALDQDQAGFDALERFVIWAEGKRNINFDLYQEYMEQSPGVGAKDVNDWYLKCKR